VKRRDKSEPQKKKISTRVPRPHLPQISEEMKAWSAALATELATWHKISTRPMFGLTAVYRGGQIFAALPRTRGMNTANSFGFKLDTPASRVGTRLQRDARISSSQMTKARWFTFEINSDTDLHAALDWLNQAYEAAK
jgi:hypothetical protein